MIYRFDSYSLDETTFELWHGSTRVPAEPQVLELLLHLIRNRDRVVSKEELLAEIWKGRIVSESALSSRIKSARRLIGDDGASQRLIRTVHRRGFRFVAAVSSGEPGEAEAKETPPPVAYGPGKHPQTRYAKSGEVHVAYHLFGEGPVDIVLAPGFVSHIDNYWDEPDFARWLNRLGQIGRVAMFDKRGTGLSDPVSALPGLDERMDDVRAVMDSAGFETAAIMGISEGGSLACLFAATHPERSRALVLYGTFARFASWFPSEESLQALFDYIERDWGSGKSLPQFAPSRADDPDLRTWWGKFERLGATPGAAIALMRMNSQIDVSDVLPSIRVPTIVIHRSDDVLIDVEGGRFLAERIPGARYVELPGRDHLAWVGENAGQIIDLIAGFLVGAPPGDWADRVLATVLVCRIEGTGRRGAESEDPLVLLSRVLSRFRGRAVRARRDSVLATFDGPARAIRCALAITGRLREVGLDVRIGVHTGEVDQVGTDLRGLAVDLAAAIAGLAPYGSVMVSRTVKDLVAGSGIGFEAFGTHTIESLSDSWHLYRARL